MGGGGGGGVGGGQLDPRIPLDHRRPASPGISPSKPAQVQTPVTVNNEEDIMHVLSCSLVWMEINGQLWAIFMDCEWIGGQGVRFCCYFQVHLMLLEMENHI